MKNDTFTDMQKMLAAYPEGGEILLHSCCGPCSTRALELLRDNYSVSVFFYNPNIYPEEEYYKRLSEQKRFIDTIGGVKLIEGEYDPERFYATVKGLEDEPEGGARCEVCFRLRLGRAAEEAKKRNIPLFATTLTVSPHKNAPLINNIGKQLEDIDLVWLPTDWKKRGGYQRSITLSKRYNIYRQDYCGCVFAKENSHE